MQMDINSSAKIELNHHTNMPNCAGIAGTIRHPVKTFDSES